MIEDVDGIFASELERGSHFEIRRKGRNYLVRIRINRVLKEPGDIATFVRFKSEYGGSIVRDRTLTQYVISARKAMNAVKRIAMKLEKKRPHALLILELADSIDRVTSRPGVPRLTEEERQQREDIMQRLFRLNNPS